MTVCSVYLHFSFGTPFSSEDSIAFWEKRIAQVGPAQAYNEIDTYMQDADASATHAAAHTFGGALFLYMGLPGISICDDRFIYGCYHQLTAEAIVQGGLESVALLGSLCENNIQCLHGIGHGILVYVGNSTSTLPDAITQCSQVPTHDQFSGCLGGVFMEFFLRTMSGEEHGVPRPVALNPFTPCDTLSREASLTCYYWQAQSWKSGRQHMESPEGLFRRMGSLCKTLGEAESLYCFAGIGAATISFSEYSPATIRTLCDESSAVLQERAMCRSSAGKALSGSLTLEESVRVCTGLAPAAHTACAAYMVEPLSPGAFSVH